MKTILTIALAAALLGCQSAPDKTEQCTKFRTAYELYQSSLQVRQPSKDEVTAATAAAAFLTMYCGWSSPAGATGRDLPVDAHGVPIIVPHP